MNYEKNRSNLESLINEFNSIDIKTFNEANTRFKFIDKILTECLAWDTNSISVEDSYKGKYTDYTLSLFRSVAILEAKKTGIYFDLPAGTKKIIQPLKSLYKDNEKIKSAINQVKGYCQDRSVQIAIISNGWQFIAFIATRSDSIPPLEGNALVIPSLDSFLANFKDIWNYLSKYGFEEEILYKKLVGKKEIELPAKISSTIYQYPQIINRNPFQVELEIISDLVFEDVIKEKDIEKEFLESCYCKSGALSNYSLVSKEILTTRYNYLFEIGERKATLQQVASKKGLSGELMELFANSLSKRPVLLVGDVGVGKSTFINYLITVEAPKVFEKSFTFKIDLGSKAIVALDIKIAVISEIQNLLVNQYNIDIEEDDFVRHCYFMELERFKKSVKVKRLYEIDTDKAIEKEIEFLTEKLENKSEHLKNSLIYISKNQRKQIIVFIDNCDQRSDQDQEIAFLIAQEFATDWELIVFVSIRPETLHRTKREKGALSGYHTKAFTIPPPRLDEVLKKRLDFAQKITNGDISLTKFDGYTSFTKLSSLIEVFKFSLDKNYDLLTFLNNVSNENIRKAIEIVKHFFGSGHVDMKKILDIYNEQGYYTIPIHELLRSVIFGDNVYYSPTNSDIINLFDVRHSKPNEHFILLNLIALLDDYSKNSRNHGFIQVKDVYAYLQGVGFSVKQIDSTLNYAYSKLLFETSQKGDILDFENTELQIRATNLAIYHLRFLVNSFTYFDSIIIDTPIFDDSFKESIKSVKSIKKRLERSYLFLEYLDKQWKNIELKSSHMDWSILSSKLKDDIDKINKIINKPDK